MDKAIDIHIGPETIKMVPVVGFGRGMIYNFIGFRLAMSGGPAL